MSEKIYKFYVSRGEGKHEMIERKESELQEREKKLLLGQLLQDWDNTPLEQQREFFAILQNRFIEDFKKRIYSDNLNDNQ